MALQSGAGGNIQLHSPSAVTIPLDTWRGNWRVRDAEVTQSDSNGATLYFSVVQDNEWEYTSARDDTNFPETIGLTPGTIVDVMWFKLGAGAKADKLVNTLVGEVATVTDNKGDVVRVTVRGKGGKLTPNQTIS